MADTSHIKRDAVDTSYKKRDTIRRIANPQIGDRFTEMCSVWLHVVHKTDKYIFSIIHNGGGCILEKFTLKAFIKKHTYGGTLKSGSPWRLVGELSD